MVAKEFEAGTIKLLLIRPARRSTILASKYLTLILISLYYLLSYLLFSFVWGALFFGFTSLEGDAQLLKNITLTYDSAYMETFMMHKPNNRYKPVFLMKHYLKVRKPEQLQPILFQMDIK